MTRTEERAEYERKWREAHREQWLALKAKWREANPDHGKQYREQRKIREPDYRRRLDIEGRYGIPYEHYIALLEEQGGCCAICAREFPVIEGTPHVDHDHRTGKVRGLLCSRCNMGLGGFDDNEVYLRNALYYLDHPPYSHVNVSDESESATETKPPTNE